MDYLGPLLVRNPSTKDFEKRWIALFTCFATRAVHLEVVSDCSADATMRAVERFCNRRGVPHIIRTDNQTGFLKAAKGFQEIFDKAPKEADQFHCFFANTGIRWTTVPERCASMNGLVERLVGLVKRALRKVLWKTSVSPDIFETLVTKVEAVINSRPLLQPGTELEDSCLTPAHFIAPTSQLSLPPWDADDADPDWDTKHLESDLLRTFHQGRHYLEQFWKVFSNSYLQELREVQQLYFKTKPGEADWMPKVGDVCLAQEPTAPSRMRWPMVRIERLLPGEDGLIRTAQVRMPSGHITRRAIKELVPLEIPLESTLAKPVDSQPTPTPNDGPPVFNDTPVDRATPTAAGPPHHDFEPVARRTRSAFRTAPFLLLLCCILFPSAQADSTHPLSLHSSGPYQICATGPGGMQLKFPSPVNCEAPTGKFKFADVNVTLFVPNNKFPQTDAFLCYFEKISIKATVGFFGPPPVLSTPMVEHSAASALDCEIASTNFTFKGEPLVKDPILSNTWTTGKKIYVKHYWFSTTTSSVVNFLMEKGEIISKDGKSITTTLVGTDMCQLSEGVCYLKEATLIWSNTTIQNYCPFVRKGAYKAKLEKTELFVTIPILQSAFHLTKKRGFSIGNCVPKRSYLTHEGPLIYFGFHIGQELHPHLEIHDEIAMSKAPTSWKKLQQNLELTSETDPINVKLSYEFISIVEKQESENYFQYCSLIQDWLHLLKQFILLHPTIGVRAALHRDDVCAELIEGIVVVHRCHQVQVDRVHWDHRDPITDRCTEYIPVTIGNETWFITPGTRDLVNYSPKISCDLISAQLARKKEAEIHYILIPNFLPSRHLSHHEAVIFSAPPLFKSRLIYGPQLFQGFARQAVGHSFVLSGLINLTSEFAFKPDQLKEALEGLGLMGEHLLVGLGKGIGAIVEGVADGAGSFIGHIIQPFYILMFAGAAILALILILICYGRFSGLRAMRSYRRRKAEQILPPIRNQKTSDKELSESRSPRNRHGAGSVLEKSG